MATPNFVSGMTGSATHTVGNGTAVEIPITGWTVSQSIKGVTYENSKTGVDSIELPTFRTNGGTVRFDYDTAQSLFDNGNGSVRAGIVVGNLTLYIDQTTRDNGNGTSGSQDGPCWKFGLATIKSVNDGLEVGGKHGGTYAWSYAGGNISVPSGNGSYNLAGGF